MNIYFTFHYDARIQSKFEVKSFGASFTPLLDAEAEILKALELWPSFVAEYRAGNRTMLEWFKGLTKEDKVELMKPGSILGRLQTARMKRARPGYWGPSKPIDPNELKDWAIRWRGALEVLSEDEAKPVFAGLGNLYKPGSHGRYFMVGELDQVIAQADCATKHGVRLRMSRDWDEGR